MAGVLDLIDLSRINGPSFSVPKPLINYIFDKSEPILSQKLIKSCKSFKLLHLKNNRSEVEELNILFNDCKIESGLSNFRVSNFKVIIIDYRYKINTVMKSIKILHFFKLVNYDHCDYYFKTLVPRLDLCQTKEMEIGVKMELNQSILEKLLQPSLKKLRFHKFLCKDVHPVLLSLQRCPKLKDLCTSVSSPPIANLFKEIVKTKRGNKLERFVFISAPPRFNFEYFMDFINNHLAQPCYVRIAIEQEETSYNEIEKMEMLEKIRETKIATNVWWNGNALNMYL